MFQARYLAKLALVVEFYCFARGLKPYYFLPPRTVTNLFLVKLSQLG